jgi:Ig-like domain-containing protein/cellulase (glycosyl hydrolase family 5)
MQQFLSSVKFKLFSSLLAVICLASLQACQGSGGPENPDGSDGSVQDGPSECEGHCVNGSQDCGELGLDCGGECPACSQPEDDAEFVSQDVPAKVTEGQAFNATFTMKNTGTTTWTSVSPASYSLGSWAPADNTTWGITRISINGAGSIAPDESITFSAELQAPPSAGNYDMQWRMQHEGSGWFGQATQSLTLEVEDQQVDPPDQLCMVGYSDYALVTYENAYAKHVEFLRRLSDKGVNLTRVWVYGYSNWEQQGGAACGANWFEHLPFRRSGAGDKYDLTDFDPAYFTKLTTFLTNAESKQVYTMLTLFDSWALKHVGDWSNNPWDDDYNIHGFIQQTDPCAILTAFYDLDNTTLVNIQKGYVEEVVNQTKDFPKVLYEVMNEPLVCANLASQAAAWQQAVIGWIKAAHPQALIILDDGADRSAADCSNPYTSVGPTVALSDYEILAPHWADWGDSTGTSCISEMLAYLEPYGKHIIVDDDGCSVKQDDVKIRRFPEYLRAWSSEAIQNNASFNHLQDDLSCVEFTLPNAESLEALGESRRNCPDCQDHCNNSRWDCGEGGIDCGGDCPDLCACAANHCENDFRDCDEEGLDCGGADCSACAGYDIIKCCRNGDERCDDESFFVPDPYLPMKLVCDQGRGGVIYIAIESGPGTEPGNLPRCRGFEENDLNEWELLKYVLKYDCNSQNEGTAYDIGLSTFEGDKLYVGVHAQPDGTGRNTRVCVASSSGADPCAGHCSNNRMDCGETGIDCGLQYGECQPCEPDPTCGQHMVDDADPGSGGTCTNSAWSGSGAGLLNCLAVDSGGSTIKGVYRQAHSDGAGLYLSPNVDVSDAVCYGSHFVEMRIRVTSLADFDRGYLEIGNRQDCAEELQFRIDADDLRGDELWTTLRFRLDSHANYHNVDWTDVSHLRFYWLGTGGGSNPDLEQFSVFIDYISIEP